MGQIRRYTLVVMVLFSTLHIKAWVRVVYDWKSTAAVMGNTTFQTAIEGSHNAILDSVSVKSKIR